MARTRVCQVEATQLFCLPILFPTSPMPILQQATSNAAKLSSKSMVGWYIATFGAVAVVIGICIGISPNSRYTKLSHP